MFSIFSNVGPEIPFTLLLMALLGLRTKVWPKVSLFVRATPQDVFELVRMAHGKTEEWGRTTVATELLDPARGIFRKTYTTTMSTGAARTSSALFSIGEQSPPHHLKIIREGLEGKTLNNELLSQSFDITPESDGARLKITYEWGPRPLIAQLMARADLWGGAFRIKGVAETGVAVDWPFQLISAAVAVVTGAIALAGFALWLGWLFAALIILVLFVHEFGHLLAYRLMGQPWGRMIFLPFLGAIAMPRLTFETQAQSVFAALMGPGLSSILAATCVYCLGTWGEYSYGFALLGGITVILNLFNLLPVEPLDGGIALRSILKRMVGKYARFGLMSVGIVLAGLGLYLSQILLVLFGGISILFNFKDRSIDAGLKPLSWLQVFASLFCYLALIAAYVVMLLYFAPFLADLKLTG